MKTEEKVLTDDDFYAKYTTVPNHIRANENNEFETYSPEIEYVHKVLKEDPSRLWTIIDNNDGWMGIVQGYHYVNRMCYLITEQACEREGEEYTIYDTTPLREQWESLPAEAIEEVTSIKCTGIDEDDLQDVKDEEFYQWEEMDELERDAIIAKYKIEKDGTD